MPKVVGLQGLCEAPDGSIFSVLGSSVGDVDVAGLYRRGKPHETSADTRDYYRGRFSDFLYHDLLVGPEPDTFHGLSDGTTCTEFQDIRDGGRWGNFDPDELFVLYEPADVARLVAMLQNLPDIP